MESKQTTQVSVYEVVPPETYDNFKDKEGYFPGDWIYSRGADMWLRPVSSLPAALGWVNCSNPPQRESYFKGKNIHKSRTLQLHWDGEDWFVIYRGSEVRIPKYDIKYYEYLSESIPQEIREEVGETSMVVCTRCGEKYEKHYSIPTTICGSCKLDNYIADQEAYASTPTASVEERAEGYAPLGEDPGNPDDELIASLKAEQQGKARIAMQDIYHRFKAPGLMQYPERIYKMMEEYAAYVLAGAAAEKSPALEKEGEAGAVGVSYNHFKQLLRQYVVNFSILLLPGDNVRELYDAYDRNNFLSIQKLILLANASRSTPTALVEERAKVAALKAFPNSVAGDGYFDHVQELRREGFEEAYVSLAGAAAEREGMLREFLEWCLEEGYVIEDGTVNSKTIRQIIQEYLKQSK